MSLNEKHESYRSLPSGLRGCIKQAVAALKSERLAIPLKVSSSNGFIFTESVLEVVGVSAAPTLSDRELNLEHVRAAYRRLVDRDRAPEVLVSELQAESGVPLPDLKAWLESQCLAHRVVPTVGEPTAATQEQLAAALQIEGGLYLYVKLLEA